MHFFLYGFGTLSLFLYFFLWQVTLYSWYCSGWIKEFLHLWDSIPNCQFWNSQWAAVIARVVKNYNFIDWECYLPALFTRYLNMFEVSEWALRESLNLLRVRLHVFCLIFKSCHKRSTTTSRLMRATLLLIIIL